MNWVPIITTAINAVASIISDKSKAKATKADEAQKQVNMADVMASNMRTAGYVLQDGTWVNQHAVEPTGEYKILSDKNKKARFGGPPLTADEKQKLDAYKASNGQANAMTNPIAYPDTGSGNGGGWSADDPYNLSNVNISASPLNAVKKAGMSPLLMLGIVGAGVGILYKANQKPKGRRR